MKHATVQTLVLAMVFEKEFAKVHGMEYATVQTLVLAMVFVMICATVLHMSNAGLSFVADRNYRDGRNAVRGARCVHAAERFAGMELCIRNVVYEN